MNTANTTTLSVTTPRPTGLRRALATLTRTDADWAGAVLRLALGFVMLPHALQKTAGLFGGYGFTGTMGFFTETMGLPGFLAFSVIAIELVASIALIVGAGTRLAALGIAGVMAGAIATVHLPNGFFMNWSGQQAGEGFEYHLLAIGIAVALMLVGGGRGSLDRKVFTAARGD